VLGHRQSVTLPVNEIFGSIQGEAHWTGMPSMFVRLQGCDVGCPWCDTKATWERGVQIDYDAMLNKIWDAATYAALTPAVIATLVNGSNARHVVITGGEPCMFDLHRLCDALHDGHTVQIETSGTEPIRAPEWAWITLSPKIAMPGGKTVLQ
jgi:7-carboxy-7-deazaguanine synthase